MAKFSFSKAGWMPGTRAERLARGKVWSAVVTADPNHYGCTPEELGAFTILAVNLDAAELKLDDKDHRCHADFLHAEVCDTALQKGMRNLKKVHLTKPPLTDEQLALFKLTAGDHIHSEHHTPQGYASVNVVNTGRGQVTAYFDEAIDTIKDPDGDRANYMFSHTLEGADGSSMQKVGTTKRSSQVINYGAEHVGGKGRISVCFQGTDGSQGPWSEASGFALS